MESAPPDAGGHTGSTTTPGDVLQTPEHRDDERPAPDLQYTNARPSGPSRAPAGALIGILILALALFIFFIYAYFYGIP